MDQNRKWYGLQKSSLLSDFSSMTGYVNYDYKVWRSPPKTPCEMKPQTLAVPFPSYGPQKG